MPARNTLSRHMHPRYSFLQRSRGAMSLPHRCSLVGVSVTDSNRRVLRTVVGQGSEGYRRPGDRAIFVGDTTNRWRPRSPMHQKFVDSSAKLTEPLVLKADGEFTESVLS